MNVCARMHACAIINHIDFSHSDQKRSHLFSNNQIFAILDEYKCKQATRCRCYDWERRISESACPLYFLFFNC